MNDKFTINVTIADRVYPLEIKREEEEMIRNAAKMVNKELASYKERFKNNELYTEEFLAMIAFRFAYKYLSLNETHGSEVITEKLEKLNSELSDYLK